MNKRAEIKFAVSKLVEEINVMKKIKQSRNRKECVCVYIYTHINRKYEIN